MLKTTLNGIYFNKPLSFGIVHFAFSKICSIHCKILIFLLLFAGLAGLTSHSLRHRGGPQGPRGRPELLVRVHEEVLLACDGGASVEWTHNGQPVRELPPGGVRGGYRLAQGSVRILRAGPLDEGTWQCEERDPRNGELVATRAVYIMLIGWYYLHEEF
jgi:hypothetical protein